MSIEQLRQEAWDAGYSAVQYREREWRLKLVADDSYDTCFVGHPAPTEGDLLVNWRDIIRVDEERKAEAARQGAAQEKESERRLREYRVEQDRQRQLDASRLRREAEERGWSVAENEAGFSLLKEGFHYGCFPTEVDALEGVSEAEKELKGRQEEQLREQCRLRGIEARVRGAGLPITGCGLESLKGKNDEQRTAIWSAQYYLNRFGEHVRPGDGRKDLLICGRSRQFQLRVACALAEDVARAGHHVRFLTASDAAALARDDKHREVSRTDFLVLDLGDLLKDAVAFQANGPQVAKLLNDRWAFGPPHGHGCPTLVVVNCPSERFYEVFDVVAVRALQNRATVVEVK